MATNRKKKDESSGPPSPKWRRIKLKEAKALLAAGGWTPDPENTSMPSDAYVSDRGQLLLFHKHGPSMLYESRQEFMNYFEARKQAEEAAWQRRVASAPPKPECREVTLEEAKSLVAAGGWTLDPEYSDQSISVYTSDAGELLLLMHYMTHSVVYSSREQFMARREWEWKNPWGGPHVIDGLIPQGKQFIEAVPALIDELAAHLKLPRESLDLSFESLRVVDEAIKKVRPRRRILETPNFFAGLTAYMGEVIRKRCGGYWELNAVSGDIWEPYVRYGQSWICPWLELAKDLNERRPIHTEAIVAGLLMAQGLS